jgi:hypothetical protein
MRWMRLYHPFDHRTTGRGARSKTIPDFWRKKILPRPLDNHFQLQLEKRGGLVVDQIDALDTPVPSILPWDH